MPLAGERPPGRVLLRHDAYIRLRAAICDGSLAPGERLRDEEVARWLGVSRTPVREALTRLSEEGLVEMAPNRFTRVAALNAAQAREAFAVVGALHVLAVEQAVPRLSAVEIDELAAHAERFTWATWRHDHAETAASDGAFHALLAEAAGNRELTRLLDRMRPILERFELLSRPGTARAGATEHELILASARGAEAGDLAAAVDAARREFSLVGAAVEGALRTAREEPEAEGF